MSFDTTIVSEGQVGFCWLLEVSFDNFATVSYYWSTASYHDGTNRYDGRIRRIGPINRSFGIDGFPASASTEIEIDNTDFAADWMVDHATWTDYIPTARFRLKLGLWEPETAYAAHPTLVTRQVGEYVCMDFPSRDASTVKVSLADDSLGRIADLAIAPSVNDWIADGDTTAANCPLVGSSPVPVGNWDAPIQLAFGNGQIRCAPVVAGYNKQPTGGLLYPIVICATTDTDASGDTPINLKVQFKDLLNVAQERSGTTLGVPPTFKDENGTTHTIWTQERTGSISNDGKTWRLIWLEFNAEEYVAWAKNALAPDELGGSVGYVPQVTDTAFFNPHATSDDELQAPFAWLAFECFWFQGYPLSARTNEAWYQSGPDVVRDLISYYSQGASSGDIDTTSFDAVKEALGPYFVGGVVSGEAGLSVARGGIGGLEKAGQAYGMNKLRQVLGELLASIDADLSITWLGKYQLTALNTTFSAITTARTAIDETRINNVNERTPSLGERFSPYNRLYVVDARGNTLGPFDHPTEVSAWGRIFPRTISAKWVITSGMEGYWSYVWQRRLVEAKHRSVLRFSVDPSALLLDLGSYFEISWTRGQGGSTPYSNDVFRVESITFDPMTLATDIEAVWMQDLVDEMPYLLDDETLPVVVSGSGGRTASVTNGNTVVTLSSGDLYADGVEEEDILILHDAANAADDFSNDIAVRIFQLADVDLIDTYYSGWTTRSGITTWSIVKGARNYPDSVSDAVNYPDDGDMYGKTSSESDVFSDASAANQLKDG